MYLSLSLYIYIYIYTHSGGASRARGARPVAARPRVRRSPAAGGPRAMPGAISGSYAIFDL